MQHWHHIGADLVGTIAEKNKSENNAKLCPELQMAVCNIIKPLIEYGNEVKLENKIKYTRQVFEKLI